MKERKRKIKEEREGRNKGRKKERQEENSRRGKGWEQLHWRLLKASTHYSENL